MTKQRKPDFNEFDIVDQPADWAVSEIETAPYPSVCVWVAHGTVRVTIRSVVPPAYIIDAHGGVSDD